MHNHKLFATTQRCMYILCKLYALNALQYNFWQGRWFNSLIQFLLPNWENNTMCDTSIHQGFVHQIPKSIKLLVFSPPTFYSYYDARSFLLICCTVLFNGTSLKLDTLGPIFLLVRCACVCVVCVCSVLCVSEWVCM